MTSYLKGLAFRSLLGLEGTHGEVSRQMANARLIMTSWVLETEFPKLAQRIRVQLPDEKSPRVGQSIAAASLSAL